MLDDGFGHWLAGFIDGEGCFRVQRERNGEYYACKFALKVRDDERETLEEIVRRTGIGTITNERADKGSKPKVIWQVQSLAACIQLVAVLDVYPLRAKKKRDYAMWRLAVLHQRDDRDGMPVGRQRHVRNGKRDWSRMIAFKEAIQNARAYCPPDEIRPPTEVPADALPRPSQITFPI